MKRWILIADAGRARILSTDSVQGPLKLEREIDFPLGRARDQEMVTDEPGRLRKGGARGVLSAMDPQTTAHEAEAQQFARQLAKTLGELKLKKHDLLAVVAPPHFLGTLKKELDPAVQRHVSGFLAKDLTHIGVQELPAHLSEIRASSAASLETAG